MDQTAWYRHESLWTNYGRSDERTTICTSRSEILEEDSKSISPKWGEVHGYLLKLYECQAETRPDDGSPESNDEAELQLLDDEDENAATPIIQLKTTGRRLLGQGQRSDLVC